MELAVLTRQCKSVDRARDLVPQRGSCFPCPPGSRPLSWAFSRRSVVIIVEFHHFSSVSVPSLFPTRSDSLNFYISGT